VVHFFQQVVGVPVVSRGILSQRTADYQNWVEAFARNHRIPIEWAEKGVRKEAMSCRGNVAWCGRRTSPTESQNGRVGRRFLVGATRE
jgi:hypothetical protein